MADDVPDLEQLEQTLRRVAGEEQALSARLADARRTLLAERAATRPLSRRASAFDYAVIAFTGTFFLAVLARCWGL